MVVSHWRVITNNEKQNEKELVGGESNEVFSFLVVQQFFFLVWKKRMPEFFKIIELTFLAVSE